MALRQSRAVLLAGQDQSHPFHDASIDRGKACWPWGPVYLVSGTHCDQNVTVKLGAGEEGSCINVQGEYVQKGLKNSLVGAAIVS